jgi:tRNA-uridine 2-sulfurtransferase
MPAESYPRTARILPGASYAGAVRVMVAMSGGVDSSVAAALLKERGHDVVGVTLKLWGGASDSGCCSVADVEDARRVCEQIGLAHHTFDLVEDFQDNVVDPYVAAHADGRTPNPCVECNRHIKFGRLLDRALRLRFDAVATGHHARVGGDPGNRTLLRGRDASKDQSYVLSMLTQTELERLVLPVGDLDKPEVRRIAARLGLRTAEKPDSQDVCFIHSGDGRRRFLGDRIQLHSGDVVDRDGRTLGEVDAVEMVTLGQRRGLGLTGGLRRYVVGVDLPKRRVLVDTLENLKTDRVLLTQQTWVTDALPDGSAALVQYSAHGRVFPASYAGGEILFDEPQRPVAPGQTLALYDPERPDSVLGSAIAA